MKKIILSLLLLVAATTGMNAQSYFGLNTQSYLGTNGFYDTVTPEYYYGFRMGGAFTSVSFSDNIFHSTSMQANIDLGVVYGVCISPSAPVYLETGLFYTEKGGNAKVEGNKLSYDLNYLDVPAVLKYIYSPDGEMTVQPYIGCYIGLGISGKVKDYATRESHGSFSDDEFSFRRFDAGLKFGCGFGYNIVYGEIGYEFGLANIRHSDFESAHNHALKLTFGVNF